MHRIQLLDYFGFTIGEPSVPKPFPKVIVWGNEFFLINDADVLKECEIPRYHLTSGFVVTETKTHASSF